MTLNFPHEDIVYELPVGAMVWPIHIRSMSRSTHTGQLIWPHTIERLIRPVAVTEVSIAPKEITKLIGMPFDLYMYMFPKIINRVNNINPESPHLIFIAGFVFNPESLKYVASAE